MHNIDNTDKTEKFEKTNETECHQLKRINDCITALTAEVRPVKAFDEFWRRGELALMFGGPGVGKSILAVQIAEALARGSDIPGYDLEADPERVLYVDMVMSEEHFTQRYTGKSVYRFSDRLYRGHPPRGVELMDWLPTVVTEAGIRYVIIDDINAIRKTGSGTTDTMKLMRDLRALRDETGISILVVAESKATADGIAPSENDLGSLAALCGAADSVFAIGRVWRRPEERYLIQTRSRNAPIVWTPHNARRGTLERSAGGMLKFRFEPRYDAETRAKIVDIRIRRDLGMTFREIAAELGISKSHAQRLATRWSPELEIEEEEYLIECGMKEEALLSADTRSPRSLAVAFPPGEDELMTGPDGAPPAMDEEPVGDGGRPPGGLVGAKPAAPIERREEPDEEPIGQKAPFMYDGSKEAEEWFLKLVSENPERTADEIIQDYHKAEAWCRPPGSIPPYDPEDPFKDMEIEEDDRGEIRYVESRQFDGKPIVFYRYNRGKLRKYTRRGYAISGEPANPNLFGRFAAIQV